MEIKLYTSDLKQDWDKFVRDSKNGTFLLLRDFIEYHKDRFNDYSLMFYEGDKLIALMPGHMENRIFFSHKGLTYGGLIMSEETTAAEALKIFNYITTTFRHQGIKKIVYKAIPHIYHRLPAEEDLYALFRHKAILTERNISSSILKAQMLNYSDSRKNGLKKAVKSNLQIEKSNDLETFWNILGNNLKDRYNKQPVHSLEEITSLKNKFPNEIHLYAVMNREEKMQAGCLIFETPTVAHAQYTAATEKGKKEGAIDLLIDYIINTAYSHKTYFDYGTSTENNGLYLNENLIYQKEGFGARGIVYDIYEINL
ncbi:MAG: GNAT family N-acetyltransferase [Dysgonomonas sp.]|nr:GNAT family N-acetyltransferase [Dysgonomonas sp.]